MSTWTDTITYIKTQLRPGVLGNTDVQKILNAILAIIQQINSGDFTPTPDAIWKVDVTYGADSQPVLWQDQWLVSNIADNLGNVPISTTGVVHPSWRIVGSSAGSGIRTWEAVVYPNSLEVVFQSGQLYYLDRGVVGSDPFVSVDFATELGEEKWVPLLDVPAHNELPGIQGGKPAVGLDPAEYFHLTAAELAKLTGLPEEFIEAHNDLTSIQGGTAGERFHLTAAELAKLTGLPEEFIEAHNDLTGIQGGTAGERFHLTADELSKLIGLPATPDTRYLRKDIADTKVGALRLRWADSTLAHAAALLDIVSKDNNVQSLDIIRIRTNQGGELLTLRNRGDLYLNSVTSGSSWVAFSLSQQGSLAFEFGRNNSNQDINLTEGSFKFNRRVTKRDKSIIPTELTRRDELPLNYPQIVATTGIINDLSLENEGVKLLILTLADELTGVIPVTSGRLLRIENRNPTGLIIRNESLLSSASNRFAIGADLTINAGEVYQFIQTNSRWRLVKGVVVGSGGVQTVAGTAVDNTDPANPVVDLPEHRVIDVGVSTDTNFHTPTRVSNYSAQFNIFRNTTYAWLSSYYQAGRVIEIELSGDATIPAVEHLQFHLNINGTNYAALRLITDVELTTEWLIKYTITISSISEIKITGIAYYRGQNVLSVTNEAVNLSANATIFISGIFSNDNPDNMVRSNQIYLRIIA